MPVFHLNEMPKNKRIQMIGEFYDTITHLRDRNEVRLFFKSLLSADEIATLMRRIEIAVLLSAKFTNNEIANLIGAGKSKITSVRKNFLQDDNGYRIIVKKLINDRKKRLLKTRKEEKERTSFSPLVAVKKKYPGHFLLDNLLDTVIEKLEVNDKELEKEALMYTPSAGNKKFK
jgi:TrpR-related protein YerC/YecD